MWRCPATEACRRKYGLVEAAVVACMPPVTTSLEFLRNGWLSALHDGGSTFEARNFAVRILRFKLVAFERRFSLFEGRDG